LIRQPKLLAPSSTAADFPDPELALDDPNGLLAIGGDLSAARLLGAYQKGIFPWFEEGDPVLWWCPDPRAVLLPDEFHLSRSLRKTLRRGGFSVSVNQCFDQVITTCAAIRMPEQTWITPQMIQAYQNLHSLGYAHSVETWYDNKLCGGIYGVAIGRMFFGESMFSTRSNASKIALFKLVKLARELDIRAIDCQIPSQHLTSLGSRLLPRTDFLLMLAEAGNGGPEGTDWQRPVKPASLLLEL